MSTDAAHPNADPMTKHPAGRVAVAHPPLARTEGDTHRELEDVQRQLANCKETIAYLNKAVAAGRKTALEMVPIKSTRAYNTLALYELLVNECVRDVVFDSHREAKLERAVCQICDTNCENYVSAPALDIFGNSPTETEQFPCENCGSLQTSSRYAPHLGKCMGLSSRGPGRTARHRGPATARSVSPYVLSDEKEISSDYVDSDDKEWINGEGKKRKRIAGDFHDKDWSTGDGKKRGKKMPKMLPIKIRKPGAPDTPSATASTSSSANPVAS